MASALGGEGGEHVGGCLDPTVWTVLPDSESAHSPHLEAINFLGLSLLYTLQTRSGPAVQF